MDASGSLEGSARTEQTEEHSQIANLNVAGVFEMLNRMPEVKLFSIANFDKLCLENKPAMPVIKPT